MHNRSEIIQKIKDLKDSLEILKQNSNIHEVAIMALKQAIDDILKSFDVPVIDVDYVMDIYEKRKYINSLKLSECVFYENGALIEIPQKIFNDWAYTGLNNMDFIVQRFWETGFTVE